mmetsp:Transcript_63519/g.163485  ORF Transcript_63519/g.163485 Transcript_63519/m.163485 type:complete len:386 (-) Transcript_63519:309-1466(-)
MTDFNAWDKKAAALAKEAEEEDEREKAECDRALGLQDGPQGPTTEKAKKQREEMSQHSERRRNFIAEQQAKEVTVTHTDETEPIVLSAAEYGGRAVRLQGSKDVTYEVPEGTNLIKLFVDKCQGVKLHLQHPLTTSFLEVTYCSDLEVRADRPLSTVQCDECTEGPVRIIFSEPEYAGTLVHHNSPSLEVAVGYGQEPLRIGVAGARQFVSRPGEAQGAFNTEQVIRGEKEYPINAGPTAAGVRTGGEPEEEARPAGEALRVQAEAKRAEGNEAFKANDFLQAAAFYTQAIGMCKTLHLAWANRAQCFLKAGQPEKALEDATKCTELAPDYAKGWFRRGMALHVMKRYSEAIPFLVEGEKLDPKNTQIPEAIKMAQMMCRRQAGS